MLTLDHVHTLIDSARRRRDAGHRLEAKRLARQAVLAAGLIPAQDRDPQVAELASIPFADVRLEAIR